MEEQGQDIMMEEEGLAVMDMGKIASKVIADGDLGHLTAMERVTYYQNICTSLGLNWQTRPMEYLRLNGKVVLYARKDCADQLRRLNGISIEIISQGVENELYVVHVRAKDKHGRMDEDMGFASISNQKGDNLGNAMLKSVTKAKRRVTLSISGLGFLDETEVETIPAARVFQEQDAIGQQSTEEYLQDPDAMHPSADQVNDLISLAMSAGDDMAKFGLNLRTKLDLPEDIKLTKKFMRESLTMTHFADLWASYEQVIKEYVEKDITDVEPTAAPQSDATTSEPLSYSEQAEHASQAEPEGQPATTTVEVDDLYRQEG